MRSWNSCPDPVRWIHPDQQTGSGHQRIGGASTLAFVIRRIERQDEMECEHVATEQRMGTEGRDMDPLTARRTWRTLEMIHGFVYFAPEPTQAYAALGLSARGLFRLAVCANGSDLGRRDRDVLQLRTCPRAQQHGWRLGQRHPRGVARRPPRRRPCRAAPDPGPRDRGVIGRGRGRRTRPPRRPGRVRASLGQAAVRRTRIPSVARRSPPRAVACTDPAAASSAATSTSRR